MAEARTAASPLEAISIVAICFGWAILGSLQSVSGSVSGAELSSASGNVSGPRFSDAMFIGLVLTEIFCAAFALLLLRMRNYAVRTLFPTPTLLGGGIGLALYLAAYLVSVLITSPFASSAAQQPVQHMLEGATVSLPVLIAVAIVNGNFEEIFLLGYLVRGLGAYGVKLAVGVSLLVRVLYHLYQGPIGALSVLCFGFVLSIYYARTQKLFPVIFAHVLGDIVPFLVVGAL